MTRFEPARGLDTTVARTILGPAVERLKVALRDEVRDRAPDGKVWMCLRGDTPVAAWSATHVVRRSVRGSLVEITTRATGRSGYPTEPDRILAVTPDHLLFTARGWIEAQALRLGDDALGGSPLGWQPVVQPHVQDGPPLIEEVFAAAHERSPGARMMRRVVNFDGEAGAEESEVEVVPLDRVLRDRLRTEAAKVLGQHVLVRTDLDLAAGLLSPGAPHQGGLRHRWAVPCALQASLHRIFAAVRPSALSRLGHVSGGALLVQDPPDGRLRRPDRLGDAPLTEPLCVEPYEVVGVQVVPASGHVYDLLTDSGWLLASGMIAHNSAADERVRPTHVHADSQEVPANLRYVLEVPGRRGEPSGQTELGRRPRDQALSAANAINCFTGDVTVDAPDARLLWISRYTGSLVRLRLASGRVLTGTPNHPVLTDRGWVALGSLHVGDNLVDTGARQDVVSTALNGEPHVQHLPPRFREVRAALTKVGSAQRMARVAVDFYGDRPDGDVEVVWADGDLWSRVQARRTQGFENRRLVTTYLAALCQRLRDALVLAGGRSTARLIRRPGPLSPLLRCGRSMAGTQGCPTPSDRNLSREENAPDWPSAEAKRQGDRLLAFASEVARDEIMLVEVIPAWRQRVYTLSTDSGIYTVAGGIVVANCRCDSIPVPDAVARQVSAGPTVVAGTRVRAEVSCVYHRVVESEYPDDGDSGGRWFGSAINAVAARASSVARRT